MRHFSEVTPAAERVVDVAEALVQRHGYNGFSYDDIAREIGIKKPSIHHHFPTKAELVSVVAQRYTHRFKGLFLEIESRHAAAPKRLKAYAELFAKTYKQDRRLCVCGMLGAEVEGLPETVAAEVQRFFESNLAWLAGVMAQGQKAGTLKLTGSALLHAQAYLSLLEGSMMVGRGLHGTLNPAAVSDAYLSTLLA